MHSFLIVLIVLMLLQCIVYFYSNEEQITFQAPSEQERQLWMDAMDGKEPVIDFICQLDIRTVVFLMWLLYLQHRLYLIL